MSLIKTHNEHGSTCRLVDKTTAGQEDRQADRQTDGERNLEHTVASKLVTACSVEPILLSTRSMLEISSAP